MSDHRVAYELREEYSGTVPVLAPPAEEGGEPVETGEQVPVFAGAMIALHDGADFDVGQALDSGDGMIVVDTREHFSGPLIEVLDQLPMLKRAPVPDDTLEEESVVIYDEMTATTLRGIASDRGIEGVGNASKDKLISLLTVQDDAVASGDQETANDPGKVVDPPVVEVRGHGEIDGKTVHDGPPVEVPIAPDPDLESPPNEPPADGGQEG